MTTSRKLRTAGVGLKSYLSSGMTSTMPVTRLRVLSHVALTGVWKLVGGKLVWPVVSPTLPRIASAMIATLVGNVFLIMIPPISDGDASHAVPRCIRYGHQLRWYG